MLNTNIKIENMVSFFLILTIQKNVDFLVYVN